MPDYREIKDPEKAAVLERTKLDIILAGAPKGKTGIHAAHGRNESYLLIYEPDGSSNLWEVKGSRSDRETAIEKCKTVLIQLRRKPCPSRS